MVFYLIPLYIIFVSVIVYWVYRLLFNRMGKVLGWIGNVMLFIILVLVPLWEQLLGTGLMTDFVLHHRPLQQITKTVQKPVSVLWVDNVWPGFDGYARELMVKSYLDGVRLKVLAMNDGKGKLYVYRATPEDFAVSEGMRPEVKAARERSQAERKKHGVTKETVRYQEIWLKKARRFRKRRKQEAEPIAGRPEVYSFSNQVLPKELAPFDYKVEWNPIPLSGFRAEHIWCDEVEIRAMKDDQVTGFNKRCQQYSPRMTIKYRGGDIFEGGAKLGDQYLFRFVNKVLFGYAQWQIVDSSYESERSHLDRGGYDRGYFNWKRAQKNKEKK